MKFRAFLLGLLAFFSVSLSLTSLAHAAVTTPGGEFTSGIEKAKDIATGAGLSSKTDIIPIIASIIQWLLALSAVLAMGAIVWGGIMYIMALGDEGKAEKAKQVIKFAIIGVIIVLISFVIISFIKTQLTAWNPWGVPTAYAATDTSKGFNSGLQAINDLIKPAESGLATDPDLTKTILRIVNFLLGLVAVIALAVMVWGALMYILSLGDEGKTERAKRIIIYAVIGVLVAGVSFLLVKVLGTLFTTGP